MGVICVVLLIVGVFCVDSVGFCGRVVIVGIVSVWIVFSFFIMIVVPAFSPSFSSGFNVIKSCIAMLYFFEIENSVSLRLTRWVMLLVVVGMGVISAVTFCSVLICFCREMISFSPTLIPVLAEGLRVISVSIGTLYIFDMLYNVCFGSTVCVVKVSEFVSFVLFCLIGIRILSPALMFVDRFSFAACKSFCVILNLRAIANNPSP